MALAPRRANAMSEAGSFHGRVSPQRCHSAMTGSTSASVMGEIESVVSLSKPHSFQSLILRSGPKDRVSKDEAGTARLRPSFETPATRAPQDEV
jgi:hypothetical protein